MDTSAVPSEPSPSPRSTSDGYAAAKRAFDVLASAIGLVLLSPVFAFIAIAVRMSSRGPVFFLQERVGRGGRPFRLIKFRSMSVGSGGPLVTSACDRRITSVGRVLRKLKLDELPQLWNVLRGDMSVVGPRPEVRRYVDCYPREYAEILSVRPGITDLAAIEYRDEEGILAACSDPERAYIEEILPAKIALYRAYLEQRSLWTDLVIVVRTLLAIVR